MRWFAESPGRWRRRFAWLPVSVGYATPEVVWLEGYWARPGGDCTEVAFGPTPPESNRAEQVGTTMSALLPCPHCGEAEELYPAHHGMGGGKPYAIDCLGCGADYTPRTGADVVAAWNRRAQAASPLGGQSGELDDH